MTKFIYKICESVSSLTFFDGELPSFIVNVNTSNQIHLIVVANDFDVLSVCNHQTIKSLLLSLRQNYDIQERQLTYIRHWVQFQFSVNNSMNDNLPF